MYYTIFCHICSVAQVEELLKLLQRKPNFHKIPSRVPEKKVGTTVKILFLHPELSLDMTGMVAGLLISYSIATQWVS